MLFASELRKRWLCEDSPPFCLAVDAFSVQAGEIHVVLGPKGAGKSTLALLLAGVEPPDGGEVRVFGTPITSPEAKHALSFLPEPCSLCVNRRATTDDPDVLIPLMASAFGQPTSELRARLCALLELLGLGAEALSTPPRARSSAARRTFDVALALAPRAPLYILDEPFMGIHPSARRPLTALFRLLRSEGHGLVITTEVPEEATIADQVHFLHDGRIIGSLHPEELVVCSAMWPSST